MAGLLMHNPALQLVGPDFSPPESARLPGAFTYAIRAFPRTAASILLVLGAVLGYAAALLTALP